MTPEGYRPSPETAASRRDQRLQEALELLETGVDEIVTSEGFQQYLDVMSRFHRYSYGNVMLIMAQNAEATRVAGYRQWQQLGRQVKRGERGLKILVPHKQRIADEQDGDDEEGERRTIIRGFGVGTVFDVSQTDGEPLPEPPMVQEIWESSDAAEALTTQLLQFLEAPGVEVVREDTRPALGYYSPSLKQIALDHSLEGVQVAKTLCHETAHFVADHLPGGVSRQDAETVAESSAYVVLKRYGVDTSDYSFPYVARWAQDRGVLTKNLAAIQRVAGTIIEGIEEQAEPPGPLPS